MRCRWYNPSLVEYGDRLISSIKKTSFDDKAGKVWWINELFICEGKKKDGLQGLKYVRIQGRQPRRGHAAVRNNDMLCS